MAKKLSKEELQKIESQIEENIRVGTDGFISLTQKITEGLKERARQAADVDKAAFQSAADSFERTSKSVGAKLDNLIRTQNQMIRGELSYNQIVKRGNKIKDEIALLESKRIKALLDGNIEFSDEEQLRLSYYKATLESVTDQQEDLAKKVEQRAGALGEIFRRLSKTPVVGELLNMEEATEGIRNSLFAGESLVTAMGKGFKAMFKGIGPLAIGLALLKAFVDLLVRGDQLTTDLAKNLDISKEAARAQLDVLKDTTGVLEGTSYVTEDILKAQKELLDVQGAVLQTTNDNVKQQAFLTKFVGLQADQAALLNTVFENQGTSAEGVYDQVNATANEAARLTGNFISAGSILREISNSSESVLANFGFSTKELSNAVLQTRRFGVSLSQASNIAGGLLDFEQSIASELEAEILLGKQFNFERARALAATGDIASATEEVLKQTQNLSDEQLRSPIIQQSLAKATGLNADELVRSIQLTRALNKSQGQYDDLLKNAATEAERRQIQEGVLQGASAEQIQKNLTAQEQFNNALSNAKDQFASLVNSGFLDMLTSILPGVLDFIAGITGTSTELQIAREAKELQKEAAASENISEGDAKKIAEAYQQDQNIKLEAVDRAMDLAPIKLPGMNMLAKTLYNTFSREDASESKAVANVLKEISSKLDKKAMVEFEKDKFIEGYLIKDTK